ncbi:MAG: sugar ABC transporter ATP-binding protein [Lachnospiraceae bacterium]|nr:sugar ABC transporter ATP-binding protein [Lachnospiraceae bacterium]
MNENDKCLFRAEKIRKTFGSVHALSDFDITIQPGEIRGLVGENGSGKSTFSSIIAGIQKCDSGKMYLEGKEYLPTGTVDAINHGISMVVQEQGTISKISVAANIFFGKEIMFAKHGVLNVKKMNEEAAKALTDIGVDNIRPEMMIDKLTFEDRKLVELARALYTSPKIWIVDETTTALNVSGRELLYQLMEKMKASGGSILFISHDIDEIMEKCDSLTILRDGFLTADLKKEEFEADKIRQLMIGRELSDHYYREDVDANPKKEVVLETKNVSCDILSDVSVQLHRGEILGVGGLSDCGMHTLGKVLFGLIRPDVGMVLKNTREEVKCAAWATSHGIGYVSKNRDQESMMIICSIKDNICLPSLKDITPVGPVSVKKQKQLAETWAKRMEVKADSVNVFCNILSGGNKQKVVLAKWLGKGSDILILDCPTRGIDVGTKAAIYQLIEKLKKDGKSILLISEELPELIGMSDRIILLKDGRISGEFHREEGMTEAKLIQKMI